MAAATRIGQKLAAGVRNLKERASSSADSAPPSPIPYLVETVISHIERKELELEGIFRISGSVNDTKALKANLEKRRNVDLSKVQNPHTISGVLKLWLRELPKPPMTFELYDAWRIAGTLDPKRQVAVQLACFREAWRTLPSSNQALLVRLFFLLHEVSKRSEINKMTAGNLAIVFGPTLLRPEQETVETMLGDAEAISRVVDCYISIAPQLLDGSAPVAADLALAPASFNDAVAKARARLDANAPLKTSAPKPAASNSSTNLTQPPGSPRGAVVVVTPQEQAAMRIQAVFRGYRVRRKVANLPGGRSFAAASAVSCARLRSRHMSLVSCIAELKSYAAIMRSSLSVVPVSPLAAAAAARAASTAGPGQGPVTLSEPLALDAEVRTIFNGIDALNDAHLAIQAKLNKLTGALPWELREPGGVLEECTAKLDAWEEFRSSAATARRTLMFVMHSRALTKRWMETMQGRSMSGLHLTDLLHEPMRQLTEIARLVAGLRDALVHHPHRPFSIDIYRSCRAAALWLRVAQSAAQAEHVEVEQELLMTEKTIVGAKEAGFIVRPGRRLVRKGELKIASEKRFVFLFNDLCLVTKQEGLSYHFKYVVELLGALVHYPPRATAGKHGEAMELVTADRPYLIVARNSEECRAWVKDLENVTAHIASRLVGVPLQDLLTRDKRPATCVPRAFEVLIEQLAQPPLGLFSLMPPADDVTALRECLERGVETVLVRRVKEGGVNSQHAAGALLCLLLQELPEPLLSPPLPTCEHSALVAYIKALPIPNHTLLRAMVQLASRIPMPQLEIPTLRLTALSLLPYLASTGSSTVPAALNTDAAELVLSLLLENPSLFSPTPPASLAITSLGTPSTWSAARLATRNKPLPRAPSAPAAAASQLPAPPSVPSPPPPLSTLPVSSPPPSLQSPPPSAPPPAAPPRSSNNTTAQSPVAPPRNNAANKSSATKSPPLSPIRRPQSPPTAHKSPPTTRSAPDVSTQHASASAAAAAAAPPASPAAATTRRNVRPLPVPGSSGPTSPTRPGRVITPASSAEAASSNDEKKKRERGAPVVGELGVFDSR